MEVICIIILRRGMYINGKLFNKWLFLDFVKQNLPFFMPRLTYLHIPHSPSLGVMSFTRPQIEKSVPIFSLATDQQCFFFVTGPNSRTLVH